MELQHSISKVIHPISYVNKVIAYGDKNMTLLNVMSGTILYEFPNLCAYLAE